MKTNSSSNNGGCPLHFVNRRRFIVGCAAFSSCMIHELKDEAFAFQSQPKKKIHIIYSLHSLKQQGPDWPNKGFDFGPFISKTNRELAKQFMHYDFLVSTTNGKEQAEKIIQEDSNKNVFGYIVFQMNCWNQVVQSVAKTNKPVLYVDFKYGGSGGFLTYTAAFLRQNTKNVGFISSSKISDLIEAIKCFDKIQAPEDEQKFSSFIAEVRKQTTPKQGRIYLKQDNLQTIPIRDWLIQLKESKILAVRGTQSGYAGQMMGIPVFHVPFSELNDEYQKANLEEARLTAAGWELNATRVEGVNWDTLVQSAAMYLAQKSLMEKYGANAITINCLGGFYGGHIHAYPCLGFHQLLNEGLVGGCECDVRSTATLLAFGILTKGRPGFISDPVLDTSRRQIIYAHCVAHNRPFGPKESRCPYQILTHSEDRQGASVRSILPAGYLVTTLQIDQARKQILIHQAKAVGNDPDDRACRTKLVAEPIGDFEKLFTMWDQWGWHRVTFYGDLKPHTYAIADALGWKVIEEV
ncbi:MAG: hypothetical protein ACP5MG_08655 [Verrucomicrobiia bacterium]